MGSAVLGTVLQYDSFHEINFFIHWLAQMADWMQASITLPILYEIRKASIWCNRTKTTTGFLNIVSRLVFWKHHKVSELNPFPSLCEKFETTYSAASIREALTGQPRQTTKVIWAKNLMFVTLPDWLWVSSSWGYLFLTVRLSRFSKFSTSGWKEIQFPKRCFSLRIPNAGRRSKIQK